jgi:heme o synthase
MLPNVVGPVETCRRIVIYTLLLVPASFGALAIPGVGVFYAAVAAACNGVLLWKAFALYRLRNGEESPRRKAAMALFRYTILYMFLLYAALLAQAILR